MTTIKVVHGDIETEEEQESLTAISQELYTRMILIGTIVTHGTNDTTAWTFNGLVPPDVRVMLDACLTLYPHWRVRIEGPLSRGGLA
jgi:hypothetical protein